jgi:flavin reductase (DIM6/NTAB) family NADH-FMN oxidoreductase RutF
MTVDTVTDLLQTSFRNAMGNVAAAVSVVTTYADGAPYGTTVSAFSSLSMDPPMMLVSLDNRSSLLGRLDRGAALGVNVLAAHQSHVAGRFATAVDDRFAGVRWSLVEGAPALHETHAWAALRVSALVPAGDHTLVLGDVVSALAAEREPLVYHRRAYGTHRPH